MFGALLPFVRCVTICHPLQTDVASLNTQREGGEVLQLDKIYINGGRRGFLVGIAPAVLADVLKARPVHCALAD